MNAIQLINEVQAMGGSIRLIAPDQVKLSAPSPLPPDLMEKLRAHKPDLLLALQKEAAPVAASVDREALAERAAIIESNGVPREWADGYALLCTMPRPRNYNASRWHQMIDDGGLFLDKWGKVAAEMGWRAIDAFGVNPRVPDTAYCDMGLVPLLGGNRVHDIRPDAAVIDCGQGVQQIYRRIIRTQAVALWQLRSR